MSVIKILFVGDGSYPMYAKSFFEAAKNMPDVQSDIMDYGDMNIRSIQGDNYVKRIEYHYCFGLEVTKINRRLLEKCQANHYDIVFLYSAELIFATTVKKIRAKGIYVAIYHNDNPFSNRMNWVRMRHFKGTIKFSNIAYAYRRKNIEDYRKYGAVRAKLLRSYYIASRNYYIPELKKISAFGMPRIGFLGHYEDDGRIEYIKALTEKGIDVGVIFDWPILNGHMKVIKDAHVNYNEIINQLDVAIIFLSSLNQDTYTRRCFEIPMAKTMMLSVYTDDLASLYEENKEIVFFRSKDDFVRKAIYYLENDNDRARIANAAYERCLIDGHEAADRVKEILADYKESN